MVDPVMYNDNWDLVQHILYLHVYDSLYVVCLMKISKQVCTQDLHTMEFVPLCVTAHEEGMEDWEISSAPTAQFQLLERMQHYHKY